MSFIHQKEAWMESMGKSWATGFPQPESCINGKEYHGPEDCLKELGGMRDAVESKQDKQAEKGDHLVPTIPISQVSSDMQTKFMWLKLMEKKIITYSNKTKRLGDLKQIWEYVTMSTLFYFLFELSDFLGFLWQKYPIPREGLSGSCCQQEKDTLEHGSCWSQTLVLLGPSWKVAVSVLTCSFWFVWVNKIWPLETAMFIINLWQQKKGHYIKTT